MMNLLETVSKVVAIAGGALAIYNGFSGKFKLPKPERRKHFEFSKELLDCLSPQVHPGKLEHAFYVASGLRLKAKEIRYLLSLPSPHQAIEDYYRLRDMLEVQVNASDGCASIGFRKDVATVPRRILFKCLYLTVYLVGAMWCLLFVMNWLSSIGGRGQNWPQAVATLAVLVMPIGGLAIYAVAEVARIREAESLAKSDDFRPAVVAPHVAFDSPLEMRGER